MLNTYAEDFLRKGSEEYRKVKMMSNQIKYKKSMPELRFCDFVKKYVEQFMLQGETIKCKPFEQQLMETNKMNTITSFRTEFKKMSGSQTLFTRNRGDLKYFFYRNYTANESIIDCLCANEGFQDR